MFIAPIGFILSLKSKVLYEVIILHVSHHGFSNGGGWSWEFGLPLANVQTWDSLLVGILSIFIISSLLRQISVCKIKIKSKIEKENKK